MNNSVDTTKTTAVQRVETGVTYGDEFMAWFQRVESPTLYDAFLAGRTYSPVVSCPACEVGDTEMRFHNHSPTVDEAARRAAEKIAQYENYKPDYNCTKCGYYFCKHWKSEVAQLITNELSVHQPVQEMQRCDKCGKLFRYPPTDNKPNATTCAWCTPPDSGSVGTTPLADVERSLLPTQESGHLIQRMTEADGETARLVRNEIMELCLKRKLNAGVSLSATRDAAECFADMINEKGGEVVELEKSQLGIERTRASDASKINFIDLAEFVGQYLVLGGIKDVAVGELANAIKEHLALISEHSPEVHDAKLQD